MPPPLNGDVVALELADGVQARGVDVFRREFWRVRDTWELHPQRLCDSYNVEEGKEKSICSHLHYVSIFRYSVSY